MNTEEQKLKAMMVSTYEEMTPDQIADDVMVLVEKAISAGFDAGCKATKDRAINSIKDWERKEIMKAMLGTL